MKKLTTPQLLEALVEQKNTGKRLGEILVDRGLVKPEDIAAALQHAGRQPADRHHGRRLRVEPGVGAAATPTPSSSTSSRLAARKGASDVQIEPKEDAISVKYRIDGFFFRVDPIPKRVPARRSTQKLFEIFRLDPAREHAAADRTASPRALGDVDYDLVDPDAAHGARAVSATIKLVNRATFLKDFTTLGLEIEDRVRLMEELRNSFGLVLVTAPVFNGANTTAYSIMNFLARGAARRGVARVARSTGRSRACARSRSRRRQGARMEETLRSVVAVRPEVLVLSGVPDRAHRRCWPRSSPSSMLVVADDAGADAPRRR